MKDKISISLMVSVLIIFLSLGVSERQEDTKTEPTYKNIQYGPHERNVLDFWKVNSDTPTPLVIFIHGGGFRTGSKENLDAQTLQELLASGISVASINYRLITSDPLPAAHHDARRALQFLRYNAKEWNLDKSKVGCFGSSAGAMISMYLAFHDEMANPGSSDQVERESTRLTCVASLSGPTTLDIEWMKKWIPGSAPVFAKDPNYNTKKLFAMVGAKTMEEYQKVMPEICALSLITADDPPIYMYYRMTPDDPIPDDPRYVSSWVAHNVIFGIKLKEVMDKLGIEADLNYPGVSSTYKSHVHFFKEKFGKE